MMLLQPFGLHRIHQNFPDQNQDEKITEDEFAALPPGESEEEDIDQMDHRWIKERRMEFRESIDLNGDKIVDRDELRVNHLFQMLKVNQQLTLVLLKELLTQFPALNDEKHFYF